MGLTDTTHFPRSSPRPHPPRCHSTATLRRCTFRPLSCFSRYSLWHVVCIASRHGHPTCPSGIRNEGVGAFHLAVLLGMACDHSIVDFHAASGRLASTLGPKATSRQSIDHWRSRLCQRSPLLSTGSNLPFPRSFPLAVIACLPDTDSSEPSTRCRLSNV